MDELNKIIDRYTEGNYLIGKTAKEEMAKDILALFSVSGSLVSDKDIETEANNRYNPKWGGLNGMTEHKKFIEGAKWVKDNYR